MLISTLGNATSQLAHASGNEQLAAALRNDTAVAVAALNAWQPGQSGSEAIRAVNRVIDDLALFPPERFRPLVTLALGTAAAIIEYIEQHGGGSEHIDTEVRIVHPPQNADEFKRQWNAVRASSVGLSAAPVL